MYSTGWRWHSDRNAALLWDMPLLYIFLLYTLYFILFTLYFILYTLYFILYTFTLYFILWFGICRSCTSFCFMLYTLYFILYILYLYFILYTLVWDTPLLHISTERGALAAYPILVYRTAGYTLYFILFTPILYTVYLYFILYTVYLYVILYTLYFILYTCARHRHAINCSFTSIKRCILYTLYSNLCSIRGLSEGIYTQSNKLLYIYTQSNLLYTQNNLLLLLYST